MLEALSDAAIGLRGVYVFPDLEAVNLLSAGCALLGDKLVGLNTLARSPTMGGRIGRILVRRLGSPPVPVSAPRGVLEALGPRNRPPTTAPSEMAERG